MGCLPALSACLRASLPWLPALPARQENYFLDDGAYGALKIVIEMVWRRLEGQGDIADLVQELR